MKILFNQPREIDGILYKTGVHDVPDELKGHWYLQASLLNGVASIVTDVVKKPVAPVKPAPTYHDHMKQWESKGDKKALPVEAEIVESNEELPVIAKDETDDVIINQPKKSNKKKKSNGATASN